MADIIFENKKLELLNFIQPALNLKKEINIERWKGKGYLYIERFPKLFIIKTIINKKQQIFKISLATVKACWRAIKKINSGFQKKSKELAKDWCKELNNLIRHCESQFTLSKYDYCIRCEEELLHNLKQTWKEKKCEI